MKLAQLAVAAALVAAAVALSPLQVTAQHAQNRDGFWLSGGLGFGSYGCEGCDGRESGGAGTLSLGGTLSQHVSLGAGVNVWVKEVDNVDITVSTVTAMIRFYPSATGGFFLTGGLGSGRVGVSQSGYSVSGSGVGLMLGLGYDIRVGNNISLTPFWHGNGINLDDGSVNFAQLGLALTVH